MSDPSAARPKPVRKCPICDRPTENAFKPFCSKRCADVDLNRWLKGVYAIPVVEEDEKPDAEEGGSRES
jgi:endogenous inhibitor of DNA gyrase (YacG/DUF329 family)